MLPISVNKDVCVCVICTDAELSELAAAIRREADALYKTWLGTSERVRDWQQKIANTTKVAVLFLASSQALAP